VLATAIGAKVFRRTHPYVSRRWVMRRLFGDPRRIPPDAIEGYGAALDLPGTIEHALNIVRSWHADLRTLQAALPKIAGLPTLLIWGSRDQAVLPNSAAKLVANFTRARLVIMPGMGHLPYEEAPEEFNRLVIEFLATSN
jgi:pimeloyl-ACP methyl ester carboxylesterase